MEVKLTPQAEVARDETDVLNVIQLFTIENKNGTKLIVSNRGAAVISLFVKDKNGSLVDIVLGYDDPFEYLDDEYYLGSVVGRYANRIAGDNVIIDGKTYKLSVREGGYHLHGGETGFNKKLFSGTPFSLVNGSGVKFAYTSPDLEEGFPGEFHLEIIYTLNDNDEWIVEYKGISDKTTIVNLTQHTYFNLSGDLSASIQEHELQILSNYYLPVNEMQVPTGKIVDVSNTPFDFTKFKKIGKDIEQDHEQLQLSKGYDHSFVLERKHTKQLKHAAIVKESNLGINMNVYTTEPAVHFYAGNFLDDIKGKNNMTYHMRSGFCLETQHFPNAPNQPDFPSTVLQAGHQFYSKTIFSFSHLDD